MDPHFVHIAPNQEMADYQRSNTFLPSVWVYENIAKMPESLDILGIVIFQAHRV